MDAALTAVRAGGAVGVRRRPGDVLLFRWRPDCAAKHAGVLAGPQHFIHAYEQSAVTRSALVPSWRRRVAGVYRFPHIIHNHSLL
jgi:NlpC/P60 family putative phage cell wall peptidase